MVAQDLPNQQNEVPDVLKTCREKKNQMSAQYLLTKSLSVTVNIFYSVALVYDFSYEAGLPLLISSGIKACTLIVFLRFTTCSRGDPDRSEYETLLP